MPEAAIPIGYGALIDAFELPVPVPIALSAIGTSRTMTLPDT